MLYNKNSERLINSWNSNTSIFTVLMYVLYGTFYRILDLPVLFYFLSFLTFINVIAIIWLLSLIFKNTAGSLFKDKRFGFASLRLILNSLLFFLIITAAISG
jgi:hypothetical protein